MNSIWAEIAQKRIAMQPDVTLEEVRSEIIDLLRLGVFDNVLSEDISAENVITYCMLIFDLLLSKDD